MRSPRGLLMVARRQDQDERALRGEVSAAWFGGVRLWGAGRQEAVCYKSAGAATGCPSHALLQRLSYERRCIDVVACG